MSELMTRHLSRHGRDRPVAMTERWSAVEAILIWSALSAIVWAMAAAILLM